jgi:hypothetical protein
MDEASMHGWKRCLLRPVCDQLEIAGAFARVYGALDATQICTCDGPECWCGFSAHNSLAGAMMYHPLNYPIAHVAISGSIRFGGGRKKEYLVGYSQRVIDVSWPRICMHSGCVQHVVG